MSSKPFTLEEFRSIYSKVPRLTVSVVIHNEKGILLSLRSISPWKGFWHIPGVTVYYNESLEKATQRTAKEELGVKVEIEKFLGYIEYFPSEGRFDHVINMIYLCSTVSSAFNPNDEASEVQFFTKIPSNTVSEEKEFLKKYFNL